MRIITVFFLLIAAVCCTGCEGVLGGMATAKVEVRLPVPVWEREGAPISHLLLYPGGDGKIESLYLPVGVRRAVIEVQRGFNVPVLAYPMGRLPPAGGVVIARTLQLRYRYGPPVKVLQELWKFSDRCETVCVKALAAEMEKEGEGDPWMCDIEKIKGAIIRGRLNRLYVRSRKLYSLCIELPGSEWISGNQFFNGTIETVSEGGESPAPSGSEGGPTLFKFSGLYPGGHYFFSPEGGLELHIYVDKKGGCRWICDSLGCFSLHEPKSIKALHGQAISQRY